MSDARALILAGKLGADHKALAERLRRLVGSENEAGMLSALHEAEAVLELKAWSSALHPRAPAGGPAGGQFVVAQGSKGPVAKGAEKKLGHKLTTHAIKEFQRRHGLKVDGLIGVQTAAALLGDKHAHRVKPGSMTTKQRQQLAAA